MKVEIKKLTEDAKLPFKKHKSDFAYDLTATSVEEIAPNVFKYGTGLSVQVVPDKFDGQEAIFGFTIRPRSSIWETGMVLANSIGTVDKDYTGELKVTFYHVMRNMPKYEVGNRIAQLHIDVTTPMEFQEVTDLAITERADGGFGSTGI